MDDDLKDPEIDPGSEVDEEEFDEDGLPKKVPPATDDADEYEDNEEAM